MFQQFQCLFSCSWEPFNDPTLLVAVKLLQLLLNKVNSNLVFSIWVLSHGVLDSFAYIWFLLDFFLEQISDGYWLILEVLWQHERELLWVTLWRSKDQYSALLWQLALALKTNAAILGFVIRVELRNQERYWVVWSLDHELSHHGLEYVVDVCLFHVLFELSLKVKLHLFEHLYLWFVSQTWNIAYFWLPISVMLIMSIFIETSFSMPSVWVWCYDWLTKLVIYDFVNMFRSK